MAKNGSYHRYRAYRKRRRSRRGVPRWLIALAVLGGIFAIALGVVAGVGYGVYQSYAEDLVPPDVFFESLPPGGARIYDRNGALLFEYLNPLYGRRDPVSIDEISPYVRDGHPAGPLIDATIAAEDASFWDNPGINYRGLAAAAWDNLSPFGDSPGFLQGRGGSSITQQLVKNVYFTLEERSKRTIDRKLKETVYAIELTDQYTKEQILEWYLNLISYGNLYTGIEAASQGYFGKPAKELTVSEAALLAGIPASPSRFDPISNPERAKERQQIVLIRMWKEGYISDVEAFTAYSAPLNISPQRFPVQAPHFVFDVVQPQLEAIFGEEALQRDGLVVYTTVDLEWQQRAEEILDEHITSVEERTDGHNGAFVAIDPKTAQTLVYIGSRDFFDEEIDGQNDTAAALNSPGSSFKPFAYLTSFLTLGWGPGTMLLDTPYTYTDVSGSFTPENPGGGFQGPITVRDALGNSLNIPAVKTMVYTGVQNVVDQAVRMGVTALQGQSLGPALVTGGGDVTLADMVYGYTAFANLGILKGIPVEDRPRPLDPVTILRVEDRQGNVLYPIIEGEPLPESPPIEELRVAPAEETYLVNHILVDPSAECIIFGCGGLSIPDGRPLAVKTGTSSPYVNCRGCTGDTWTYAYTPQIVVGTWYGNADNSPMRNVNSTTISWPIVREFLTEYLSDLPVERWIAPPGLDTASVCIVSGLLPTGEETLNCPTTPDDLFAQRSLPEQEDDWWSLVRINVCTPGDLLASEETPEQCVEERYYLDPPPGLSEFALQQAEEWVGVLSAAFGPPPTEVALVENFPVAITSPADGTEVEQGTVLPFSGRASSRDFSFYRLEYRPAAGPPDGWLSFTFGSLPVIDGPLGNRLFSDIGSYLIRIVVVDDVLGEIISDEVRIEVIAPPEPEPTPIATPAQEGRQGPPSIPPGQLR
ncbi:MAG: transglycosylase domain-containing protein, partial [Chloroflexi bacterium]|nr:transglycosylase domain-containing protein [Chloroflexota bacterium]